MSQDIPTSLAALTADWLTRVLRGGGVISERTTINTTSQTLLGVGEGFMGEIARVRLGHDGPETLASLIAKIPTTVPENRGAGQMLGIYEREVRAYLDLLPNVDVPVPVAYAALLSDDATGAADLARMVKADRLPIWALRILVRREQKTTVVPPALLLLEDLHDAVPGDQVAGCSPVRAAAVLRVAARFHASTWGPRLPQQQHWLSGGDVAPRLFQAAHLNSRRGFRAYARTRMAPHSLAVLRSITRSGRARITNLHRQTPRCVVHGDLRLDNLFFDSETDVRAVIDWQVPNLGPAVLDIGYFLVSSLDASVPESEITELLGVYHDELFRSGVKDYSFARLQADYTEALLLLLHRATSFDSMDFGEERGRDLLDTWINRFDARLARVPA
ncbi:MAG: phosphotransferase [Acidimicrobiales bacterium]|nr:phosphotransferase [Acidimicrobiales bacterium]MDG2219297.1 phosphotransferase [Acidimicrobiales bacterium]